jgi:hypothetical protein
MASPAQIKYILGLAEKKDTANLDPAMVPYTNPNNEAAIATLNNKEVNTILIALRQLPYLPKAATPVPAVETEGSFTQQLKELEDKTRAARYFIIDPIDNVEKFFKFDKPEPPSKWAGKTFLSVQASDFLYPIKNPNHKYAVLKAIQADPIKAMNEYGIRLEVCGMCGRTLTARDSRLRGLGPICAGKILGEATPSQMELLDKLFPNRNG